MWTFVIYRVHFAFHCWLKIFGSDSTWNDFRSQYISFHMYWTVVVVLTSSTCCLLHTNIMRWGRKPKWESTRRIMVSGRLHSSLHCTQSLQQEQQHRNQVLLNLLPSRVSSLPKSLTTFLSWLTVQLLFWPTLHLSPALHVSADVCRPRLQAWAAGQVEPHRQQEPVGVVCARSPGRPEESVALLFIPRNGSVCWTMPGKSCHCCSTENRTFSDNFWKQGFHDLIWALKCRCCANSSVVFTCTHCESFKAALFRECFKDVRVIDETFDGAVTTAQKRNLVH